MDTSPHTTCPGCDTSEFTSHHSFGASCCSLPRISPATPPRRSLSNLATCLTRPDQPLKNRHTSFGRRHVATPREIVGGGRSALFSQSRPCTEYHSHHVYNAPAGGHNGQNFCILDDQRFSREILPKYFKHNNLSSFIRQLNMYGFRKVMSLEGGLVRSDRASAIEFQHPFFKKGRAELLEHIKRKISTSVRSEDPHLSPEELQKVFFELQELKDGQNNMDAKLENMRSVGSVLVIASSVVASILQFILSLMRGNIVMGPPKKRFAFLRSTLETRLYKSMRFSALEKARRDRPHKMRSKRRSSQPSQRYPSQQKSPSIDSVQEVIIDDSVLQLQSLAEQTLVPSSSTGEEELALDVVPPNSAEDDDSDINSILNENSAAGDYDLLYRGGGQGQGKAKYKWVELKPEVPPGGMSWHVHARNDVMCTPLPAAILVMDPIKERGGDVICRGKGKVRKQEGNAYVPPLLGLGGRGGGCSQTSVAHKKGIIFCVLFYSAGKQLMQYTGNPVLSLFDLASSDYGAVALDPANLLTAMGDDAYAGSSSAQNDSVPGCSSSKEPDLLVEDFGGPQEVSPSVLGPVNNLIDEAKESETLGV
ncbi:PREDICTED: uncharacterized protein LOC108784825 [Nanorana parkeri]|uniref:uncharacterized protein LOC108784825 n=1 Tax=Nanorana parkeri TaxID=125878 RepID=UPI000854F85F|nr:PREDICTED: uncharacterized protein LOC108784825 [Nanorana parkeri]